LQKIIKEEKSDLKKLSDKIKKIAQEEKIPVENIIVDED
jgi:hypothetical protein